MEMVKISSDLEFSRVIHGHWRLADWKLSNEELLRLVEECIDLGVTTIDHADIYGNYTCEDLFGQALALKPEIRSKIQLVTKCGIKLISNQRPEHKIKYYDTSKEHIIKSAENSLKSLRTDYIDVLLIHRPDPFMNPEEVAEAFSTLKREGKVLYFGVSNFKPSQFNMLSAYLDFPLVTNQIEISPVYLDHFDIGTIEQCQERRIAPMAWSPLAGGRLFTSTDEQTIRVRGTLEKIREEIGASSIDQVTYAWLFSHPAKVMPIVGSRDLSRIKTAVEALELKLTRQQWFEIWQSSKGREVV